MSCISLSAYAGNHDPKAIIALLANSKSSLIQGVKKTEENVGSSISPKFAVNGDGTLALSVYNIPEGLQIEPEYATLTEFSRELLLPNPKSAIEVFTDKRHISRDAAHMTLMKQFKLSFWAILGESEKITGVMPIDIREPTIANGKPIAQRKKVS